MKAIIKFVLPLSCLILTISATSQSNLGNTWILGEFGYQINFNTNPITHDTAVLGSTYWDFGHSNICDTNGRLLLCSDGMNIYDSTGAFIDGGDTLVPKDFYNSYLGFSPFPQSSIILPMDSDIYYLVTPTFTDSLWATIPTSNKANFDLLLYNVIDMKANAGAGKVIKRMKPLLQNADMSKYQMMACRHGNGKDWWLLKMADDSVNIYTFLFKQDTVINYGIQRFPFIGNGVIDLWGQMQINQQGTQMASVTSYYPNTSIPYIYTANFDRCSGLLSNYKKTLVPTAPTGFPVGQLQIDSTASGLCYSPNGRFLYLIKYSSVMQLDLQDNNMPTAWYQVCGMDTVYDWFSPYTNAYLGSDGKIYIGYFDGTSKQMSTIDNPDIKGSGCNFCRKCLRSKSNQHFLIPPCMPNYSLSGNGCWPDGNVEVDKLEDKLVVYPNPSNNKFRIICKNPNSKKELYNSVGQLVITTFKNEIDVSNYSKGVYYLRCGFQTKKLIIE